MVPGWKLHGFLYFGWSVKALLILVLSVSVQHLAVASDLEGRTLKCEITYWVSNIGYVKIPNGGQTEGKVVAGGLMLDPTASGVKGLVNIYFSHLGMGITTTEGQKASFSGGAASMLAAVTTQLSVDGTGLVYQNPQGTSHPVNKAYLDCMIVG